MSEASGRTSARIEPETSWTFMTEAPLKGFSFACEAGRILAWDEGNQLYLLNAQGESLSSTRVRQRIMSAVISAEGSLIAVLCEDRDTGLLILSADLEIEVERNTPMEASFLSVDTHGRYIAIGTRSGPASLVNRYGRNAGRIETIQPLAHLCFIAQEPFVVGSAAFGMLTGIELSGTRDGARLDAEVVWQDRLMSNVGRLSASGDGGMILASCFTHGIQRFDIRGRNEGSYHLGGTISHAVPDFPGRTIAVATLEGEIAIMNSAGNVRWRTRLPRPAIALDIDPLGRYIVHGHSTGEITRLDLFGPSPGASRAAGEKRTSSTQAARGNRVKAASGSVRKPDWTATAVQSEVQAETAVLAVSDDPTLIAVFSSPHRLEFFDVNGQKAGVGPEVTGVGRIIRTSPGWLAAATDRQIGLCDLRRGTQRRVDVSLVELTHLAIRPDTFGLATVQERDRVSRVTPAGRWVWKHELRSPVEDLVIGPEGFAAVTTNHGEVMIFDPAGTPTVGAVLDPADPPLLIESPDALTSDVVWIALSRRMQQLSGHDLRGRVKWTRPLPWDGWSLTRVGRYAVVASVDGKTQAYDSAGTLRFEGPASGQSNDHYFVDATGEPLRLTRKDVHLICTALDGRVRWRAVGDQPLGPLAVGASGVAILIGHALAWFKAGSAAVPLDEDGAEM